MPSKKNAPSSAPKVSEVVRKLLEDHKKRVEDRNKDAAKKAGVAPLSEILDPVGAGRLPEEIQDRMSSHDCADLLRGMAENDPNHVISRNYFRVHSGIKESTWNRYYGTFEEFKRQAGIKLSRHVHRLERELAKHASVDHYRATSLERMDWGDKYERPSKDRYQTILVGSDFHDIYCDPFALRVFLDTARRASDVIKTVVLNGDVFDLPEFSRFFVDPREWGVVERIKFVHENILNPIREAVPDAQIDLIEGNHESRMLRHLSDATPAMRAVLADLVGLSVSKLLGLERFQVNYVGKGDLGAWSRKDLQSEVGKNFKVYHGFILAHHFIEGKDKNLPGWHGHSHKHRVWPMESPIHGPYEWHQLGAMCARRAVYTDADKWSNGFMLVHVDTHKNRACFEYVPIMDFAFVGGKFYERAPEELVGYEIRRR